MAEEQSKGRTRERRGMNLSVTQVVASALATVVGAILASRLGVYGTIAGAVVMSVLSTSGSAIFTHLFHRTGDQLKQLAERNTPAPRASGRWPGGAGPEKRRVPQAGSGAPRRGPVGDELSALAPPPTEPLPATRLPSQPTRPLKNPSGFDPDRAHTLRILSPAGEEAQESGTESKIPPKSGTEPETELLPGPETGIAADLRDEAGPAAPAHEVAPPRVPPEDGESVSTYRSRIGWRPRNWKVALLAPLLVFALAMGTITAVELVTDKPISATVQGEDGSGTTLGGGHDSGRGRTTPSPSNPGGAGGSGSSGGPSAGPSGSAEPSSGASSGSDGGTGGTGGGGTSASPSPEPSGSGGASSTPSSGASGGSGGSAGQGSTQGAGQGAGQSAGQGSAQDQAGQPADSATG